MNSIDKQNWGNASFQATNQNGAVFGLTVSGGDRWALECLITAGPKGCTPIDTPGPRWSVYVHNLRSQGLSIETVMETHAGPFAGTNARYVLQSIVTPIGGSAVAA